MQLSNLLITVHLPTPTHTHMQQNLTSQYEAIEKKKAMVITSFFKVQDNTSRLNSQITTSAKRRVGYDACLYITSLECNHAKLVTWTNIIYSFSLIVNLCKKNEVAMAAMHSRCCISITIHGIYTKHCTYNCKNKKK